MSQEEFIKQAAPLLVHLSELRRRVIRAFIVFLVCFVICFFIKDYILHFLLFPYEWATQMAGGDPNLLQLQSTQIWETFLTKANLAAFAAFIVSLPYSFYHLYRFIAPGLYEKERKNFFLLLLLAPFLFFLGASFVYALVAPFMLWFSLGQQSLASSAIKIDFWVKISNYLSFMTSFIVIFGLIFQLPLIAILLKKTGVLCASMLVSWRKWALLSAMIFAAIITPPDIFTMLGVAMPMLLLYEASIFILRLLEKREKN